MQQSDEKETDKVSTKSENLVSDPEKSEGGVKLLVVFGVLSVILFTSCVICGIVVALLRNNLTNAAGEYALLHVLIPLLVAFVICLFVVIFGYLRYKKLSGKESTHVSASAEMADNIP